MDYCENEKHHDWNVKMIATKYGKSENLREIEIFFSMKKEK